MREKVDVEDLALDFTIPGYDIELRVRSSLVNGWPLKLTITFQLNGRNIAVEGFSKVFPITDLQAFALDELVMLFGNAEEDWSIESESFALPETHGD